MQDPRPAVEDARRVLPIRGSRSVIEVCTLDKCRFLGPIVCSHHHVHVVYKRRGERNDRRRSSTLAEVHGDAPVLGRDSQRHGPSGVRQHHGVRFYDASDTFSYARVVPGGLARDYLRAARVCRRFGVVKNEYNETHIFFLPDVAR